MDPSPRCCTGEDCLQRSRRQHAVVTALRTENYLPLLLVNHNPNPDPDANPNPKPYSHLNPYPVCPQELACSLAASNPAAQLVVLAVRGELASGTVKAVEAVATIRYAEPVFFESLSSKRCRACAVTSLRAALSDEQRPTEQQRSRGYRPSQQLSGSWRELQKHCMAVLAVTSAIRGYSRAAALCTAALALSDERQTHGHVRRFGLNWFKVRLWELTEFDAVLYVDSDAEVLGSIAPVFDLPADFAVVMDPNKEGYACANPRAHLPLSRAARWALLLSEWSPMA